MHDCAEPLFGVPQSLLSPDYDPAPPPTEQTLRDPARGTPLFDDSTIGQSAYTRPGT
jgi:hypothetical protein